MHGHATPENKRVAILISILAALLAITVGVALGLFGWLAPTLLHL